MGIYYTEGRYLCELTSQNLGQSSTGTTQIVIGFRVMGGINPSDPEGDLISCQCYDRKMYLYLTDKTAERTAKDLAKIGYASDKWSQIDENTAGFQDLRGSQVTLECSHDVYEGQARERWRVPFEGAEVKPLEPADLRKLDALYGKALKQNSKPRGKTGDAALENLNEKLQEAAAKPADNDIPF